MNLSDLKVVLTVSEFNSITMAATQLDMHVATASAAIKRVEKSLGAQLFIRSTRKLRLSAAGESYIPECKKALDLLQYAHTDLTNQQGIVEGELNLALSSDLGRNIVIPLLDKLMSEHKSLKIKIDINDSNVDFYRDKVDVALRYGCSDDKKLYGFKICDVPGVLCASPDYLKENGEPQHPQDLNGHNGLFYQLYGVTHHLWKFTSKQQTYKINMSGNRAANDGDLVRRWCVAGHGIAVKSCIDMSDDLLNGKVVSIMRNYQPRSTELWLVCPARHLITPAVRLLRDVLKQTCHKLITELTTKGMIVDLGTHIDDLNK